MPRVFRWLYWSVALGVTIAALVGCSSTNLADVIKAAGTDPATVCARVTSVYGTLTYLRTNVTSGDVGCDALTVKTTVPPTSVALPMVITPTFRIAPQTQ